MGVIILKDKLSPCMRAWGFGGVWMQKPWNEPNLVKAWTTRFEVSDCAASVCGCCVWNTSALPSSGFLQPATLKPMVLFLIPHLLWGGFGACFQQCAIAWGLQRSIRSWGQQPSSCFSQQPGVETSEESTESGVDGRGEGVATRFQGTISYLLQFYLSMLEEKKL